MEPMMQLKNQIQLMSPADYSAMKEKLIREARIAQAAAVRAAFTRLIAAVVALAARLSHPGHTCRRLNLNREIDRAQSLLDRARQRSAA
jgi:hypothetical protein